MDPRGLDGVLATESSTSHATSKLSRSMGKRLRREARALDRVNTEKVFRAITQVFRDHQELTIRRQDLLSCVQRAGATLPSPEALTEEALGAFVKLIAPVYRKILTEREEARREAQRYELESGARREALALDRRREEEVRKRVVQAFYVTHGLFLKDKDLTACLYGRGAPILPVYDATEVDIKAFLVLLFPRHQALLGHRALEAQKRAISEEEKTLLWRASEEKRKKYGPLTTKEAAEHLGITEGRFRYNTAQIKAKPERIRKWETDTGEKRQTFQWSMSIVLEVGDIIAGRTAAKVAREEEKAAQHAKRKTAWDRILSD